MLSNSHFGHSTFEWSPDITVKYIQTKKDQLMVALVSVVESQTRVETWLCMRLQKKNLMLFTDYQIWYFINDLKIRRRRKTVSSLEGLMMPICLLLLELNNTNEVSYSYTKIRIVRLGFRLYLLINWGFCDIHIFFASCCPFHVRFWTDPAPM